MNNTRLYDRMTKEELIEQCFNKDTAIEELKHNQLEILSHFDTIVLAFGSKANQDLYQEIKGEHVHLIGDASKAGDAKKAIFESTQLALKL